MISQDTVEIAGTYAECDCCGRREVVTQIATDGRPYRHWFQPGYEHVPQYVYYSTVHAEDGATWIVCDECFSRLWDNGLPGVEVVIRVNREQFVGALKRKA